MENFDILLKILPFIFILPGAATVYAARWIVKRFRLDEKVHCDFESELSDEEIERYKRDKAVVNVKILGILIALPGVVMVFMIFR